MQGWCADGQKRAAREMQKVRQRLIRIQPQLGEQLFKPARVLTRFFSYARSNHP
jgi:hypothetical protein